MMPKKLFTIAYCIITCFLFSCETTTKIEEKDFSFKDSTNQVSNGEEIVLNNNHTIEPIIPDSILKIVTETINSLSELNKRLNKMPSFFVIKTNRDTVI